MPKNIMVAYFLLCAVSSLAQTVAFNKHGFYIPQNLTEANAQLDKILTPKAQKKFRQLTPADFEHINRLYILSEWESEWPDTADTRLVRYLNSFIKPKQDVYGYDGPDMRRHLVLLSYWRHLQNQPFDLTNEAQLLNATADSIAQQSELARRHNLLADSIDGVYIPRNLPEVFEELDRMVSEADKQEIRNPEGEYGLGKFHFGLGLWMRNNWQLWGGSRLQQYFEQRYITHPDNMSGIILTTYSSYLNGKKIDEEDFFTRLKIASDTNVAALDTNVVHNAPPPPPPKMSYAKPYRKFLRKRRIDDFDALPPEAYGEAVEIID